MTPRHKPYLLEVDFTTLPLRAKRGVDSAKLSTIAHTENRNQGFTWLTFSVDGQTMAVSIVPSPLRKENACIVKSVYNVLDKEVPYWVKKYVIDNIDFYRHTLSEKNNSVELTA